MSFMLLGFNAYAATKNVVPRNDQEGQLGTRTKQWGSVVATGAVIRNVEVSTLTEVRQIRFVGTTATQTTPMTQNTTFFVNASSASYVGVINESTNPVDWSMLQGLRMARMLWEVDCPCLKVLQITFNILLSPPAAL